jgi:streptogramin lyase
MIRTAPRAAALCLAVLLTPAAVLLSAPPAAAISITEFSVPNSISEPGGITAGPGGTLWFTELTANKIGRLTTAGVVTNEFTVTGNVATDFPTGIVEGPDGNLWFSETTSNAISRLTPAGVGTKFNLPTAAAQPVDITPGPDGALWFTEFGANRIGRITTAGAIQEFTVPTAGGGPISITAGPDGNLWFTEEGANKVGRLTPQGGFKEFAVPTPGAALGKIASGPDGNLWFTEINGNQIGRITPQGVVTEFPLPTADANPAVITPGPDGNLWFTEINAGQVGRITPAGAITEFAPPTSGTQTAGITTGPDGNIWFTEPIAGKVARINLAVPSSCTPGGTTLCIDDQPGDKRWQVRVSYHTAQAGGLAGDGHAIPLAGLGVSHGGLFWFFGADNPEMLVKVLNACTLNQKFWIYASATTNVAYTLTVTDTKTGRTKVYANPDGKIPAPVQDTSALACTSGTDFAADSADAGAGDALSPQDVADFAAPPSLVKGCASSATTLCIDGRFAVTVSYHTAQAGGRSGSGQVIGLQSLGVAQGGLFWFFGQDNPEMLVKVLNGCALNHKFWVYYAAGTNVGFTVKVTDTQTGHTHSYTNADGKAAAPVQDTSALACE